MTTRCILEAALTVGVTLATASAAFAQPATPNNRPATPGSFTRLEQRISDIDPLRNSLRTLPTDLRQPMGFKDVFRIEGSGAISSRFGVGNASGQDLLARVDGGVTAVFPQSVYAPGRKGIITLIPPGTVFFIGGIPRSWFGDDTPASTPTRLDSQVDMRAESAIAGPLQRPAPAAAPRAARADADRTPHPQSREATTADAPAPPAVPSIMTDETVRRTAVRELLSRAADSALRPHEPEPATPAAPDAKRPEPTTTRSAPPSTEPAPGMAAAKRTAG